MDALKIRAMVEKHRDAILAAEQQIWKHPETGFKEWKTSAYLEKIFTDAGYTLTKAGDIPGFYTDLDTGRPGPKVLILSELDALDAPNHFQAVDGCAHACGHHAQCAAMVGIALALKEPGALDGLSGSVRLMAVPAEELIEIEYRDSLRKQGVIHYLGGKVEYMYRGFMDGVDIAYMFHTSSSENCKFDVHAGNNGCIAKTVVYEGRASHAGGSPHLGINALYAASLGLQAANALRETFRDSDHIRFHPIMTAGGSTVNIIPNRAVLSSYVRGATMGAIAEVNHKINRALASGALAMGAKVTIEDRPGYAPLNNSPELIQLSEEVMNEVVGPENVKRTSFWGTGSTDMGDLSTVMPVLHPHISGASGAAHGDAYYIKDPETACVASAVGQVAMLCALLENDAARAGEVIANFKPLYASKEDYFAAVDKFMADREMIVYGLTEATVQL